MKSSDQPSVFFSLGVILFGAVIVAAQPADNGQTRGGIAGLFLKTAGFAQATTMGGRKQECETYGICRCKPRRSKCGGIQFR